MKLDSVEEIKEAIGNIRCYRIEDDELLSVGTTFLIKNDTIMTALHTVEAYINNKDHVRVEVTFRYNDELENRLYSQVSKTVYENEELDIVILKIEHNINEIKILEFAEFEKKSYSSIHNVLWKTFGFPIKHGSENLRAFEGYINDCLSGEKYDLSLKWIGIEQISSEGLSGSPMLIKNKVLGMIIRELNPNTGATIASISTNQIISVLNTLDIQVATIREDDLPFKDMNLRELQIKIEQNKLFQNNLIKLYLEQLVNIRRMRLMGNVDDAWIELKSYLKQIQINSVKAKYNIVAAIWEYQDSRNLNKINEFLTEIDKYDSKVDKRSINARISMLKGESIDEVIETLKPFNTEEVAICALILSLEYYKPKNVEYIINTMSIEPTHQIRYCKALCYLALSDLSSAKNEIEIALREKDECPSYIYAEGLISYWGGIPEDIRQANEVNPIIYERDTFIPNVEQTSCILNAIKCFKKLKEISIKCNNKNQLENSRESIFMAYDLLPDKRELAYKEALIVLEHNKLNGKALVYIARFPNDEHMIDLEYLNNFKNTKLFDVNCVIALLLYLISQDKADDAIELIEKTKSKFWDSSAQSSWVQFRIYLSSIKKNVSDAEFLLREDQILDKKHKNRLRCILFQMNNETNKVIEVTKQNISLYSERLDFKNLIRIYYKNKDWKSIISLGIKFLKRYNDAEVIELIALSYREQGEYLKCLKILEDNQTSFPYGKFSIRIESIRIDVNWSRGDTGKALLIAQEMWETEKNPRLLLNISRLLFVEGKTLDAIIFLRTGLNNSIESIELYFFLAELLADQKNKDAFNFIEKALKKYENNPNLVLSAINFGFRFGYDDKANQLLGKYSKEFKESGLMKQISVKEMLSTLENRKSKYEDISNLYKQGKIPLHIFLDFQNTTMARHLFSIWQYNNKNLEYLLKVPLMTSFGGKKNKLVELKGTKVLMDYTACITASLLNLFDIIENNFEQIIIPHSLLETITNEIYKMRDVQKSVIDSNEKLLECIKTISITKIKRIYIQKSDTNLVVEYLELWEAAKENEAYVVKDAFSTEIIKEEIVTEGLENLRIYTNEVLQVLLDENDIEEDIIERYYRTEIIRKNKVDLLKNENPKLIVNKIFLNDMRQLGCLETISEKFELLIFEDEVTGIEDEMKSFSQQNGYSLQLIELRDKLVELKCKNKLILTPVTINKEYVGELSNLLYEELTFAERESVLIWIDDRHIMSYENMGKASIVNTFDILGCLREKLGRVKYEQKVHELLKRKSFLYIPSIDYCWPLIKDIEININQYEVKVNKKLSVIKETILSGLVYLLNNNVTTINDTKIPEVIGYTLNLQKFFDDILIKIWNEPLKTEHWRMKISDWLLSNFYGYTFSPNIINNKIINEINIALQTQMLILTCTKNSTNDLDKLYSGYYKWLFVHLECNWQVYPQNKIKVIEKFIENLNSINGNGELLKKVAIMKDFKGEKDTVTNELVISIFFVWINRFPETYQQLFYDKIKSFSNFSSYIQERITVDGFPEWIELKRWIEICKMAVSNQTLLPLQIDISSRKVEIISMGSLLYDQGLAIKWIDENKNIKQANVLEPYLQLYSDNVDKRIEWIELAKCYIEEKANLIKYKEKLSEYHVEECFRHQLKQEVESSYDFFFDRLKYLITVNKSLSSINMLPNDVSVFLKMNIPPNGIKENFNKWRNNIKCIKTTAGIVKTLDILAALPIGHEYSIVKISEYLIEEGLIEYNVVIDWCMEKICNLMDFTSVYSAMSILLSNYNKLEQENREVVQQIIILLFDSLDKCFINVNTSWETYILLIKLGWKLIEDDEAYIEFPQHNKVLWSYIYASKVITILNEINNSTKLDFESINNNINELLNNRPLNITKAIGSNKEQIDVICPCNVSIFRVVFGGILDLIETYKVEISDISTLIYNNLDRYQGLFSEGMFNINGAREQYYIFDNAINEYNNYFNNNQREKLESILINNDNEIIDRFQARELAENCLRTSVGTKQYLNYIWFYFNNGLSDNMNDVIEVYIDNFEFNYESKEDTDVWINSATLVSRFSKKDKKKEYVDKFIIGCIKMIENNKADFKIVVKILASLCVQDSFNTFCYDFINLIEDLTYNVDYKCIAKEFTEYINCLMWWMPTENYSKINKLRLYSVTHCKIINQEINGSTKDI
ncbi:hypothetical protein KTC96_11385 [Clostridium estertheticum]|uniref:hypothetical protein n=1 Tax=Clostridium estertheticum TaxID=238834 RepID=UPI001C7E1282|nr:hypothetical protein [Clostridium estertheticum]MBX4261940.1 hypothetical protein [Clostridium estertheticum]WLC68628.1 hypothetical protein KTC96_11385 [Clostridium estertheticum]